MDIVHIVFTMISTQSTVGFAPSTRMLKGHTVNESHFSTFRIFQRWMDTTVDLCLQESPGKGIGRNENKLYSFCYSEAEKLSRTICS